MQAVTLEQVARALALANEAGESRGRILLNVFETLDHAAVRYCVLHGYEDYPQRIKSDVDCVIDAATTPAQLYAVLHYSRAHIGAEIVRCRGGYIVLAGKDADGSPCFLTLDLTVDCELDGLPLQAGAEVLESRRRHGGFWIPAADLEFGCYLARSIAKGVLDEERTQKLSRLFKQDAAGCAQQVARFWKSESAEFILQAARSGDWGHVRRDLDRFRAELRRRAILQRPGRFIENKLRGWMSRIRRLWQPDGLSVVLLGPDGAGKSSVVDALGPKLHGAFARTSTTGFAPPLHRLLRRGKRPTDQPHALPPRSFLTSLVRAAYWLAFEMVSDVKLRVAVARSTLVLNDRHFVDILVDRKRYRYGGPVWLLWLIWRLIPKPDVILVLDAPPEVLQARKQEVSYEETARQREAYLSLVRTLPNGHVVDAAGSLDQVTDRVSDIILRQLRARIARRLALEQGSPR